MTYAVTYPDGAGVLVESRFQAVTLTARFGGTWTRVDVVMERKEYETNDVAWDRYVDWYNGKRHEDTMEVL